MKNFVQPGDTVTVVAPVAVNSGEGLLVGALFGIATGTAAIGANVEMITKGVVDLPKAAVAVTQGAKVYWDNAAKNVTTTSAGNTLIGCAIVAAAVGDATTRVRLNGVVT
jgi:predicted RecA/RadA family phage recombinase